MVISRTRATLLTVLTVGLLAVAAGPAAAQTATECPTPPVGGGAYPPNGGTLQVSDTTVAPGETITVGGTGFAPNSQVNLTLEPGGTVIGTVPADPQGRFCATVVLAAGQEAGNFDIVARGVSATGEPLVLAADITVQAAAPAARPAAPAARGAAVAATGAFIARSIGIGLALIAAGSFAVYGARRRRLATNSI